MQDKDIENYYLFKDVGMHGGVYILRESGEQFRDGWQFVGKLSTLIQKEREEAIEEENMKMAKWCDEEGNDTVSYVEEFINAKSKKTKEEAVRGFAYKYFDFAKTDDGQGGIAVYSTKVEFFMFLDRFLAEKESFEKFESKQNETPLPDLLDFLS